MATTGRRTIRDEDLQRELKLHAWTGFVEWVENHCDALTLKRIHHKKFCNARIMELADFGLAGAVSRVWWQCLDVVVGVLV